MSWPWVLLIVSGAVALFPAYLSITAKNAGPVRDAAAPHRPAGRRDDLAKIQVRIDRIARVAFVSGMIGTVVAIVALVRR
jgi:hypothetical protein